MSFFSRRGDLRFFRLTCRSYKALCFREAGRIFIFCFRRPWSQFSAFLWIYEFWRSSIILMLFLYIIFSISGACASPFAGPNQSQCKQQHQMEAPLPLQSTISSTRTSVGASQYLHLRKLGLLSYITDAQIHLQGYDIIRGDRSSRKGGGVLLYISDQMVTSNI